MKSTVVILLSFRCVALFGVLFANQHRVTL